MAIPLKRTYVYHLNTLFLFTKSDFKTVVIPQAVFTVAFVASQAPEITTSLQQLALQLLSAVAWIWLHLLVENISNQRLPNSIMEDSINKPWRPIPSGRLTQTEAESLLRLCVLLAVVTSLVLKAFQPSTTLMTLIWLYNDLGGSGIGPLQRNAINAAGICCFGWGSVSVLMNNASSLARGSRPVDECLALWLGIFSLVITTTVHAQDFPDVEGDRVRGRKTMPLIYGEGFSRWFLAAWVLFWSLICPAIWHVVFPLVWCVSVFIGLTMATLTVFRRSHNSDVLVWKLWCVWIAILYLLPLFENTMV